MGVTIRDLSNYQDELIPTDKPLEGTICLKNKWGMVLDQFPFKSTGMRRQLHEHLNKTYLTKIQNGTYYISIIIE